MSSGYELASIPGLPGNLAKNLKVGSIVINRFPFEQPPTLDLQLLFSTPVSNLIPFMSFQGVTYVGVNTSASVDLNSPSKVTQINYKLIDERSQLLDAIVDGWNDSEPSVDDRYFIENPIRDMNKATFDIFNKICSNSSRVQLDLSGIQSIRPFFKPKGNLTYRQVLSELSLLNKQFISFDTPAISLIPFQGGSSGAGVSDGDMLGNPGLQVTYNSPIGSPIDRNGYPYVLDDVVFNSELEGYYLEPLPEEIPSLRPNSLLVSPEGELILRPKRASFFDVEQREEPFFRAQFFRPNPLTILELPEFKSRNELLNPEEDEEVQSLEYTIPGIAFCQSYSTPFAIDVDKNTPYHYQGGPIQETIEQCFDPGGELLSTSIQKQGAVPSPRKLVKINDYYTLEFEDIPSGGYYVNPQREIPVIAEFETSQTDYTYKNIRIVELPGGDIADLPNNKYKYEKEVKTVLTNFSNIRTSVGLALEESDLLDLIATYNSTLALRRTAFKDGSLSAPNPDGTANVEIDGVGVDALDRLGILKDCIRTMAEKLRDGSNIELKAFAFKFGSVESKAQFILGVGQLTSTLQDARGKGAVLPEEIYQAQQDKIEEEQIRKYLTINDAEYTEADYLLRESQIRNKLAQAIELAYSLIYVPSKAIVTTTTKNNILRGSEIFSSTLSSSEQRIQEQAEIRRIRLALIFEARILDRVSTGFDEHYDYAANKRSGTSSGGLGSVGADIALNSNIPDFGNALGANLAEIASLEQAINDAKQTYTEFQNTDKPAWEIRIEEEQECRSQAASDLGRAIQIQVEIQTLNDSLRQLELSIEDEQRNLSSIDNDISLIEEDIENRLNFEISIKENQIGFNDTIIDANSTFESLELSAVLENENDILEQEINNIEIEANNRRVEIENLVLQQEVIRIAINNITLDIAVVQADIADLFTELGVVLGRATCAANYSSAFRPINII